MSGASLFSVGDPVVLVDELGELVRDIRGRPLRGVVLRAPWYGELVVSLDRSGKQVRVAQVRARRCPQLAYARPRLAGSAA
ncbi:MAG TPA: hypothetical protein VFX59_03300 [Polyangiales bacterium]|nr:hypothetical protein [Polyangiales bacterium]